jgi:hypothetical protein
MRAALLVVLFLLLPRSEVAAQRKEPIPFDKMTVEALLAEARYCLDDLANLAKHAELDKHQQAYRANVEAELALVRAALGEKGVRIPGIMVSGSGAETAAGGTGGSNVKDPNWGRAGKTTQQVEVPKSPGQTRPIPRSEISGSAGMSTMLPLMVVLTAAQMTECTLRGVSFGDCAADIGLKTAGGMAVGTIVMVLSASGKPLVAALATGAGVGLGTVAVGSAVITTVYAGIEGMNAAGAALDANEAEALLVKHQAINAARMTPASLNALIERVSAESVEVANEFASVQSAAQAALALRQELEAQVQKARTARSLFDVSLDAIKRASATCADPRANPVRLAGDAERAGAETRRLANAAVTAFTDAQTLATPCERSRAVAARDAYTLGTQRVTEMSSSATGVRDMARDAAAFFPVVKLGRDAGTRAASVIVETEALLESARRTAELLRNGMSSYRAARNAVLGRHSKQAASVRAIHDAFGPAPPAAVKAALVRADALVLPAGATLSDDEMRRLVEATDTEVNRIEGLLRTMRSTAVSLEPCPGIADAMPAQLRTLFNTVVSDVVADERRAAAAAQSAANVPTVVSACLNEASKPAAAGWFGSWNHIFGTLTLSAAPDQAGSRTALAMDSGLGPAIPCGAADTVVTGEITIKSLDWGSRVVTAPVVGCVTNGTLVGRFSNQSRLTATEAATGNIRAGRFRLTLVGSARTDFEGSLWRWNQVTRQDFGGSQVWAGRKQ